MAFIQKQNFIQAQVEKENNTLEIFWWNQSKPKPRPQFTAKYPAKSRVLENYGIGFGALFYTVASSLLQWVSTDASKY